MLKFTLHMAIVKPHGMIANRCYSGEMQAMVAMESVIWEKAQ